MEILVGFCGVGVSKRPLFGLLNPTTLELAIVQPAGNLEGCVGIMGLARCHRYIYAAPQVPSMPARLFIFDRERFSLVNTYVFQSAGDVHSLLVKDSSLYVVSSATDEVLELRIAHGEVLSENVFWRPEPLAARTDIHHLNSICAVGDDLIVSGFGKKSGYDWNSALHGFIRNISKDEKILSGIRHPHSVSVLKNRVAYCASKDKAVRFLERGSELILPGYTRGLCCVDDKVFIGTSRRRKISKSGGEVRDHGTPESADSACCQITRVLTETLEVEETIDVSAYATEIYDLLPVSGTEAWPVIPSETLDSLDQVWLSQTEELVEEVLQVIAKDAAFILADDNLTGIQRSVAGRRVTPFLERDGQYWGSPSSDEVAIKELDRLRKAGLSFLVFAWPAFWWMDYYTGFYKYITLRFARVLRSERTVVFDLRSARA